MEPKMEEVQRRLLEEKKDLEFTYGVHIGFDAVTAACNIVFRYFNVQGRRGRNPGKYEFQYLQKQAANLLQKACLKLRYEDGTSREEKELDMAEYCLHRAIVEIMELRKERDPLFKSWYSYVQAELEGLMEKLDRFMQVRTPKMPLLQQRSSKDVISSLKATRQQLASDLSSVSLAPLGVLVTKLASMIPEDFKGDLTVTQCLIAEVSKPLIGVPSPLLLHYLRLPVPEFREKLDEKCHGQKFTVLQLVNALSQPKPADRPVGSFIFMGEDPRFSQVHMVAEGLAETLYEGKEFLIKLDMSDYSSGDALIKLLGARAPSSFGQPNNVEGHLSEAVKRKPFSVVMLRNFEKAHDSVTSLLVEILKYGKIRDGLGNEVDFGNTIIIITLKLKGCRLRCSCYEFITKSKQSMRELVKSMGGESKHNCQFRHCLTTAEQNCPSLVNIVDDIVFVELFSIFHSSNATRVEMRDIALPRGVILYPSEAALDQFRRKKLTRGESQIDEAVAPMIQEMQVGNKLSGTDIIYLDIMLGSGELSYRLADYEKLILDPLYKQFDESLKEFRALYKKEKQKVQSIYLLMLKISQFISTEVAGDSNDLSKEVLGLFDNLDDYVDAPSSSDKPGCKEFELSCLPEEVTVDKGRLNKRVKKGVDNLLVTLSEKSLQQYVATDVIEKALLELIINKPENLSLCRPKSYLLLGLHCHGKAHFADYLGKNLVTGDGVTLVVDIDLSDFSDDTALLRLKNELARSIGNVQQPSSSQVVGDMTLRPCNSSQVVGDVKLRPCNIFLLNHVEKAHISVFSALLSALDVGMCRDSNGNMIDFRDTVIILTSELGNNKIITRLFEEAHEHQEPDPLQSDGDFRSELLNCVDEILFFNPVVSVQNRVARLQMRDRAQIPLSILPKFLLGLFKAENDPCFKHDSCDGYGDTLRCFISYVPEEECTFKIRIMSLGALGRQLLGDGMSFEVSSGDTIGSLKAKLEDKAENVAFYLRLCGEDPILSNKNTDMRRVVQLIPGNNRLAKYRGLEKT
ncbi:ATPase, AAA-2 [Corchorus capsularis]|uniref:ATPase, AAA-2 n=1 Tax=Corchorus capsularis TaxID=210143 RepID=A0A1R3KX35_COCAP|nr:ATPase, AAA-2 [Corchorus capsularis]